MPKKPKKADSPVRMLGAVEVTVFSCRCRCGHDWITREQEHPRVCPKCKSPNWDREKLYERAK